MPNRSDSALAIDKPASRCTVRLARPNDEEAIVRLLEAGFPRWPGVETGAPAIDHLRWKIAEPRPSIVVVGEIDGAIAGMSIRSLRPAKVGRAELVMQHGFDSCVHPDYRGTGVMSVIRASFQSLLETRGDVMIWVSAHPAFDHFRETEGALPLGSGVLVLTCNEPSPAGGRRETTPWTIEQPARFDERVDALWDEAASQFDFAIARRQELMNWRYCDPRAGSFVIKTAEESGRLLGYAVLRVTNGIGHIADLLALPGRLDVVRSLVVEALDDFAKRGVATVQCWSSRRHPYAELLTSLGFGSKRRTLHLGWVAFTSKPDRELLADHRLVVHYMAGDSDLV